MLWSFLREFHGVVAALWALESNLPLLHLIMILSSAFLVGPPVFNGSAVVSLDHDLEWNGWLAVFLEVDLWPALVKCLGKSVDFWSVKFHSLASEHDLLLVLVIKAGALIKDQVSLELELGVLGLLEPNQLFVEGFEVDVMDASRWSVGLGSQLLWHLLPGIIRLVMILQVRIVKCRVILLALAEVKVA